MTASPARDIRKVPFTLTAMIASHVASSVSITVPEEPMPALLTRMSRVPKAATVSFTTRRQSPSRETSAACARARAPASAMLLATSCAASSERSTSATDAPSRPKASAVARPIPEPAPVTSATLPSKRRCEPAPDGLAISVLLPPEHVDRHHRDDQQADDDPLDERRDADEVAA